MFKVTLDAADSSKQNSDSQVTEREQGKKRGQDILAQSNHFWLSHPNYGKSKSDYTNKGFNGKA